jgi:hypothetical protein
MSLLANCIIGFHTNDEDKDDDTHVTVDVFDGDAMLCAHVDNDFGHFDDHSYNGPFALVVCNPSTREACERGLVRIRIDPNGHDTWRFNFELDLQFDDGLHVSGGAAGLELTQDRREQNFGLSGMLYPATMR